MRNRIKNIFKDKIITGIIIIIFFPIISLIFKIILENGRFIGTVIRKLIGN